MSKFNELRSSVQANATRMFESFARLSRREKIMIASMGSTVVAVVFFIVVVWVSSTLSSLEAGVIEKTEKLKEVISLRDQYTQSKAELERFKARVRRLESFSLPSFIEEQAKKLEIGVNNIDDRGASAEKKGEAPIIEQRFEVDLQQITLDRLTEFLSTLENSSYLLKTRKLHIRVKQDGDRRVLEVSFILATYQLNKNPPKKETKG